MQQSCDASFSLGRCGSRQVEAGFALRGPTRRKSICTFRGNVASARSVRRSSTSVVGAAVVLPHLEKGWQCNCHPNVGTIVTPTLRVSFELSKSGVTIPICHAPERVSGGGNPTAPGVDFQRQESGQTGSGGSHKAGKTGHGPAFDSLVFPHVASSTTTISSFVRPYRSYTSRSISASVANLTLDNGLLCFRLRGGKPLVQRQHRIDQ